MHDTCGVTSLHCIPGILSAICSVVIAAIADYPQYKNRYYLTLYILLILDCKAIKVHNRVPESELQ